VIYLDSPVALAHLLVEDRVSPAALWAAPLVSSRLLEYELWTRIHARRLGGSHGDMARPLLGRVAFLELAAPVLARALEPFPVPVRTLDALHLTSLEFLWSHGQSVRLASYDARLLSAARRLGLEVHTLWADVADAFAQWQNPGFILRQWFVWLLVWRLRATREGRGTCHAGGSTGLRFRS
jgi:hypothetical protein